MKRFFAFLGATVGGYAGWQLGAPAGLLTGYLVSVVGSGAGIYVGIRLAGRYQ